MSAPPLPPRPVHSQSSLPPPVPPLPPDFLTPTPLAAPRPHRFDVNMAQSLDDQAAQDFRRPSPRPLPPPGPSQQTPWQPWNPSPPPPSAPYPPPMQSYQAPAPAQSYQAPAPTQSYQAPAPAQSFQSAPFQSFQSIPSYQAPAPAQSSQAAPTQPFQAAPAQSFQSTPSQSFQAAVPIQAFQSTPAQALQSAPSQSFQSTPPQSLQSTPTLSFQSALSQTSQTIPTQTFQSPPLASTQSDPSFSTVASLSFSNPNPHPHNRTPSVSHSIYPPSSSPPKQSGSPSLISPLPSISNLSAALPAIQQQSHDPALKITWARDIFFLVDRLQQNSSPDNPIGPAYIPDPQLARLVQIAIPLVLNTANPQPVPNPIPRHVAEAIYLRATFAASGAYPDFVQINPRSAFRDFELAARSGYSPAWFRLGRDYENFSDFVHAKECFENGVNLAVESCIYRMGMAHLMGQLGLPARPEQAVPLLHRAATLASLDVPQPAYVYGLLLLAEFSHVTIPPPLFSPLIPPGSTPIQESRKHLERAAFLNFAPAQYKLGHSYEFAQPPFPFDPLLSVQYYSLASQQGEIEADMALSKWFLCGAEGAFEKDESLAVTFAEKAARKGLPSAEFAMGYYAEVGVGCPKDVDSARKWYIKASDHGNADATERLRALSQAQPQPLSRQEHNTITEHKLIRKRTQAKQRSEATLPAGATRPGDGRRIVDVIRKNSIPPKFFPAEQPSLQAQRLQTVPEQQPATARHRRRPSAPDVNVPISSPRPRPTQPGGRLTPTQNRYTLTDEPQRTQLGRPLNTSPAPAGGNSTPPPAAFPKPTQENTSPPVQRPSGKGPTTFAEMGFQSGKADEKECVIM